MVEQHSRTWWSEIRRPSRNPHYLSLQTGPCLHYLSMPGPGVQRRWSSVTRSQCPRVYFQDGKEGNLWGSPLAPSLFLVCVCVAYFIRKSTYLFPFEPPCLGNVIISRRSVCWFILWSVWGLYLLLHAYNCLNANYRSPCVGKSVKLEKVLLCWNT